MIICPSIREKRDSAFDLLDVLNERSEFRTILYAAKRHCWEFNIFEPWAYLDSYMVAMV